jgi:putative addiction module component (TIGR02574 family)
MLPTIQELSIDRLSVEDRIALVQEIWDSVAEEVDQAPLSDAQRKELARRLPIASPARIP